MLLDSHIYKRSCVLPTAPSGSCAPYRCCRLEQSAALAKPAIVVHFFIFTYPAIRCTSHLRKMRHKNQLYAFLLILLAGAFADYRYEQEAQDTCPTISAFSLVTLLSYSYLYVLHVTMCCLWKILGANQKLLLFLQISWQREFVFLLGISSFILWWQWLSKFVRDMMIKQLLFKKNLQKLFLQAKFIFCARL